MTVPFLPTKAELFVGEVKISINKLISSLNNWKKKILRLNVQVAYL